MARLEYNHKSAIKPAQVEELVDFYVNRKLAAIVVQPLMNTAITPNQLTLASTLFGGFACLALARGTVHGAALGALSILLAMVMDCADGQLARARGGGTRLGRIFDGLADYINAFGAHLGLLLFVYHTNLSLFGRPAEGLIPFLVVAAAGASMILHAALFDFHKGRFQNMTGICKPETDSPADVEADLRQATHLVDRVLLWGYWRYCRFQATLNDGKPAPTRHAAGSPESRELSRAYELNVRLWSFLGPTTHMAGICLAAAVATVNPYALWWYLWSVMVPGNIAVVALIVRTRQIDKRMAHLMGRAD